MASNSNKQKLVGFRSAIYRSGNIYNWITRRLYDTFEKFTTIAKYVGKNVKVLDLPCGSGYLARFVSKSVEYYLPQAVSNGVTDNESTDENRRAHHYPEDHPCMSPAIEREAS